MEPFNNDDALTSLQPNVNDCPWIGSSLARQSFGWSHANSLERVEFGFPKLETLQSSLSSPHSIENIKMSLKRDCPAYCYFNAKSSLLFYQVFTTTVDWQLLIYVHNTLLLIILRWSNNLDCLKSFLECIKYLWSLLGGCFKWSANVITSHLQLITYRNFQTWNAILITHSLYNCYVLRSR